MVKYRQFTEIFEKVEKIQERLLGKFANVKAGIKAYEIGKGKPQQTREDKENKVFHKDGDKIWICRNCGHVYIGANAKEVCPVCNHPQSFMEVKAENYK